MELQSFPLPLAQLWLGLVLLLKPSLGVWGCLGSCDTPLKGIH